MAHGNAVVDGDGIELGGKKALFADQFFVTLSNCIFNKSGDFRFHISFFGLSCLVELQLNSG